MNDTVDLSQADIIGIGSEVAGFLMFKEWNAPPDPSLGVRTVTLDLETVNLIADEVAARLL